MPESFNRSYALIVGGQKWTGLRMTLTAKLTLTAKPNQGEIEIYDLNPQSRGLLQEPGVPVTFLAGYGDVQAVAFAGQVWQARHKRAEENVVTAIKANDGTAAYLAHARKSWASGTKKAIVVKALIDQMGLTVTPATLELVTGAYTGPRAVSGPCAHELDAISQALGLHWSIDGGQLKLVPFDGAGREAEVLLSAATGLIGWPEVGEHKPAKPTKAGSHAKVHPGLSKGGTVKAVALFDPLLRPGRRVKLQAVNVSGTFRCDEVEIDLDSHDESRWVCRLTLRPLLGV